MGQMSDPNLFFWETETRVTFGWQFESLGVCMFLFFEKVRPLPPLQKHIRCFRAAGQQTQNRYIHTCALSK